MAKSEFFPSYKRVARILRKRVIQGDYALKTIPSERHLAEEFGVNYMTVRRGLQMLEDEGFLLRQANGRVKVKRVQHGSKEHLNFAFIVPTLSSAALEVWYNAMERAVVERKGSVRTILYMHWEDPILTDAIEGFDGIFLAPVPEPVTEATLAKLRRRQHPVVVVDHDFSQHGIPSLRIFPPKFIQRLLDHLAAIGHTEIGCLNSQSNDHEIAERIGQWRVWMSAHGLTGRLVNDNPPLHSDPCRHAYDLMTELLTRPEAGKETAWFCTTAPAALGAMRAMIDRGIQPGRDISICTPNGEGFAAMLNPSLTAFEPVDPYPFLSCSMDWMRDGQHWQGPLLMEPTDIHLAVRESTQPIKASK